MKKILLIVGIILVVLVAFFAWLYNYSNSNSYIHTQGLLGDLVSFEDSVLRNVGLETSERERRSTFSSYKVQEGDTLESIAQEYELKKSTLIYNNNLKSEDLKVGQEIMIPATDGIQITVKEGDTLDSIVEKYGVNKQAVADYNWLDYPYTLTPGDKLFLPDATL